MIAGVPYDAEIEYLESTGTQYFFTGYNLDYITPSNIESFYSRAVVTVLENTGSANLFGTWHNYIFGVNPSGYYYNSNSSVSYNDGTQDIEVRTDGWYFNGTLKGAFNYWATEKDNIYCFAGGYNRFPQTPGFKGRIHLWNLAINNTQLFDYIPVRVGSGANAVGYMYDRVTRNLFGNAGTGAFTIGPDVATPVMGLRRYPQSHLGKMGARHMIYGGN